MTASDEYKSRSSGWRFLGSNERTRVIQIVGANRVGSQIVKWSPAIGRSFAKRDFKTALGPFAA